MFTLFQMIVVYVVLLIIAYVAPGLKPILYAAIFFILLLYIFSMFLLPFGQTIIGLFGIMPGPYVKLLVGSALLFILSELVAMHIREEGYGSIASLSQLAMKIVILTLWIPHLKAMIETLSSLITK